MRNLLSSRLLIITVVLVICVMLIGQNLGITGAQASAKASASGSALATTHTPPAPHMDWALTSLLLGGALITLLRPRRRKVVQTTDE